MSRVAIVIEFDLGEQYEPIVTNLAGHLGRDDYRDRNVRAALAIIVGSAQRTEVVDVVVVP